jgi:ribosomal protein S18 acetylase RimI-like enzyme
MEQPTDHKIVVLKSGQARAGAAALVRSHADYPAFTTVYPDRRTRAKVLKPFFLAAVRDAIPFGAVYAAVQDGVVMGIAVWLPPGAFPWSQARKLRATWAFTKVWAADRQAFVTFTRLGTISERNHPSDAHWSLEALGIRPEAQRQGLGSRLVEPMLRRADDQGVECYLETSDPKNIAYYERFGFRVVTDEPLLLDGPPHIAMRRPVGGKPPAPDNPDIPG